MASSKSQNLLHFLDCSDGGDPGYFKVINKIYQNKSQVNKELVSKELNHLAAILHVYAGGLNFMK